jgi:hypothetical protein
MRAERFSHVAAFDPCMRHERPSLLAVTIYEHIRIGREGRNRCSEERRPNRMVAGDGKVPGHQRTVAGLGGLEIAGTAIARRQRSHEEKFTLPN